MSFFELLSTEPQKDKILQAIPLFVQLSFLTSLYKEARYKYCPSLPKHEISSSRIYNFANFWDTSKLPSFFSFISLTDYCKEVGNLLS